MKEVIMQVQSFSTDYPKAPMYVGDLVRCKDCKWWQDSEVGVVECPICTRIHDMVFEMGADDFCSRGERKGGDTK